MSVDGLLSKAVKFQFVEQQKYSMCQLLFDVWTEEAAGVAVVKLTTNYEPDLGILIAG